MTNNHILGDPDARAKAQVMQALAAISQGIYVQAAARIMANPDLSASSEDMQQLARDCRQAATDFFAGLGVLE